MGAAGDMLTAALSELTGHQQSFITKVNYLGIPGVRVTREEMDKMGVKGSHFSVKIGGIEEDEHIHTHSHGGHTHTHSHTHLDAAHSHDDTGSLKAIVELIKALPVSEKVKEDAIAVYNIVAEAESEVHGEPVELVHFHEVGAYDAVTDIVSVCMLMEEINADKILCSDVHVGSGTVKCAHGILPVPAPATAKIAQGMPTYSADIKGELLTPTGAALLKHFVDEFRDMPVLRNVKMGVGAGKKDFEKPNVVRVFLGEKE